MGTHHVCSTFTCSKARGCRRASVVLRGGKIILGNDKVVSRRDPTPMKKDAPTMVLKPNERLSDIRKDYHVRKQGGEHVAYVVTDRFGSTVLIGQKLSALVYVMNGIVTEEVDKVSVPGLYHKMHRKNDDTTTTSGNLHHRWKITSCQLEAAIDAFNQARKAYDNAIVVGPNACYTTTCVSPAREW